MTASGLTPMDTLTVADIQKIVDQVKHTDYPSIRPSRCKCGKHGVYWVWTSRKQKEEADEILSRDPVHMEFITHLKECGMNHSLDPLKLDDIVAIDSERNV